MKLIVCVLSCTVMLVAVAYVPAQRRPGTVGDETGRDAVGFRKDSVTKETVGDRRAPAKTPSVRQAVEDFGQIQRTNRRIQEMVKVEPLAWEELASAAKDINTRAKRLNVSLALPAPPKEIKDSNPAAGASTDEFLNLVKELDDNVRAFVTNPAFRTTQTAGKSPSDDSKNASASLRRVIDVSHELEQSAQILRRAEKH